MTQDDFSHFMHIWATLMPINLAADIAMDCCEANGRPQFAVFEIKYPFIRYTYRQMGELFTTSMEIDEFKDYCEKYAEGNYRGFCNWRTEIKVPESYASPGVFETIMRFYLKTFVAKVKNVLSKGYDWDVVASMIRMPISEGRFRILDIAFGANADGSVA